MGLDFSKFAEQQAQQNAAAQPAPVAEREVIDIEEFQFYIGIVDLNGQVVGDVIAERRDGTIVIGAAPFSEEIRKAID